MQERRKINLVNRTVSVIPVLIFNFYDGRSGGSLPRQDPTMLGAVQRHEQTAARTGCWIWKRGEYPPVGIPALWTRETKARGDSDLCPSRSPKGGIHLLKAHGESRTYQNIDTDRLRFTTGSDGITPKSLKLNLSIPTPCTHHVGVVQKAARGAWGALLLCKPRPA